MIPHTHIPVPESIPEVGISPLIITLVEEAFDAFGKNIGSTITFQKRLQGMAEEDVRIVPDYIRYIRCNSILNECVKEIDKARFDKDFSMADLEAIVEDRDTKLQIAVFLREIADEECESRSLKRAEDLKNRMIEFVTLGHVMLNMTTLTAGEIAHIMRQPKSAEDSLH